MSRRKLRPGWIDMLVVIATSTVFAAAVYSQGHSHTPPVPPPTEEAIQEMAEELGVTADELRRAAQKVPPPPPGTHLTAEQRAAHHRALAAALALPPAQVDAVFERHGPPHIERVTSPQ